MSLPKIASVYAHELLAKLIDLGIAPPTERGGITAVARSEENRLQTIVIITEYDGPLRIHPNVVARIQAMSDESPPMPPKFTPKLTPLQAAIMKQLTNQPQKAEVISLRLGRKKCSGSFRQTLNDLTRFGLVIHDMRIGYRLA